MSAPGAAALANAPQRDQAAERQALLTLGRLLAAAGYRHTAISAASHQRVVQRAAARADPAPAMPKATLDDATTLNDIFGLSHRFSADQLDPAIWGAMNQAGIVRRDGAGWRSKLRVASSGGDQNGLLFFHSAYPTLDDDAVFFDPDTYRFLRVLRTALAGTQRPLRRAIDIGAGAGGGAILIARHWPHADVVAVDLNHQALMLTGVNAALAGAHGVRPVHSDAFVHVEGGFDLIVAHPPYLLDPCGRPLRHGGGAHGEQRSFDIVRQALGRLNPGGRLLLYTGVAMVGGRDPLRARLAPLLDQAGLGWHCEEIDPDIHGDELDEPGYETADRIAAVWLDASKP